MENSSDLDLCFYTKLLSEVSCQKSTVLLEKFQMACASAAFTRFVEAYGLAEASFERNSAASVGNRVHDQFVQACKKVPKTATLAIVFHGTHPDNIKAILRNGLDPKKRRCQAYGPGEYFSTEPGLSTRFCKGGKQMLVFVVVVPMALNVKKNCPSNIVVVPTKEHQLPLGVIAFSSTSHDALARSTASRARMQELSNKVYQASAQASMAKLKAKIIQMIINDQIDLAGKVYEKNKDTLCILSKREISMYAHRRYDADFVIYFFPSLPEPMTVQERDAVAIKSVDHLEDDLSSAKQQLAQERKQQWSKSKKEAVVVTTKPASRLVSGQRLVNGKMEDFFVPVFQQ